MDFFRRFMAGRYGSDPLNNALLILGIALIIVARILGWAWMNVFILALLCLCYFRMFSRKVYKRRAENEKYLRATAGLRLYFRGLRERWSQRRDYKFFRCPSCRTLLRVPKGKGKLKVVCRKCGNSFIKKT